MRIGGKKIDGTDTLVVLNPSTGQPVATVSRGGADEINFAVTSAKEAFDAGPWTRMTPHDRTQILWQLANLIEDRAEVFAQLDALDNGKPVAAARGDAQWAARHFRYFAGWPDKIEGGRLWPYHAMELPVSHGGVETRPGTGSGQYRGFEAIRRNTAVRSLLGRSGA